jgi:replicative superfamily II helicase
MVDFKKRLRTSGKRETLDPVALYDSLDRASDKGPLRPVQEYVLSRWHTELRKQRDLIVKLHTGQGKTLIGLLMLQSQLHESREPVLYLCPNHFLVDQTCSQARQFGITVKTADEDLPHEFLDGQAILVTTAHKLFNGLTKFGVGTTSLSLGTVLMDDCHTCIDVIKHACSITLSSDTAPYKEILRLFSDDLRQQRAGTFSDIENGDYNTFLPVPYWAWIERCQEVTKILSANKGLDVVKFSWPLLRDIIDRCICIISGKSLEIVPYTPPLDLFGSYYNAAHRIFMSATVTDDSFLLRGLGLAPETICNPLVFPKEKWCGEKMILIPSLVDSSLNRDIIIQGLGKPREKRTYGVVALCPSFRHAEKWKAAGADIADTKNLLTKVDALKEGGYSLTLCVANRYDGIDLPDDACRILIMDSKPMGDSLLDRYYETCRPGSEIVARRIARIIEQGMGRSVRGEKDYCVIVLIGVDLVYAIRSSDFRTYYSAQTQKQIDIGLEIAEFAREEISEGKEPLSAFSGLIKKVLDRDEGWKEFYVERMETLTPASRDEKTLHIFSIEAEAEQKADAGRCDEAARKIQSLIDDVDFSSLEKGWYLQEMARLVYRSSKSQSGKFQAAAHNLNHFLLKPKEGVVVKKLELIHQRRVEAISAWVGRSNDFDDLSIRIESILGDLRFGVEADTFEQAFTDLGEALGFSTERPDKEWGEGPDNLWCLRRNEYILVECKNQVDVGRDAISKTEAGQMNTSCAWFIEHYGDVAMTPIMVFPGKALMKGVEFSKDMRVMREKELNRLVNTVRQFFTEFSGADLADLDPKTIQKWLGSHNLDTENIASQYAVQVTK